LRTAVHFFFAGIPFGPNASTGSGLGVGICAPTAVRHSASAFFSTSCHWGDAHETSGGLVARPHL
jgi:hypothetical protein